MELTKDQQTEIYREAVTMINAGKNEPEIRSILKTKGADDAYITTVLGNVYGASVKQQEAYENAASGKSSGNGATSMVIGGLICLAGIIATMATDGQTLFYGAIIVGAIKFIQGIVQASSN